MPRQSTSFDFGTGKSPRTTFELHEKIISDRGSVYSVSFGLVKNREEIKQFLKTLKQKKGYATASHNSFAVRIAHDGTVYESKSDDGEVGAGMVILRIMQAEDVTNCVICVTRWFGGTKLMSDRFKHLQDATKYAIREL